MTNYLMSTDGSTFLMACFAALSALAFLASGDGDKMRVREMAATRK